MASAPLVPRPAATLILLRDTANGIETFLMQRTQQANFLAGAYVFPGGALTQEDRLEQTYALCTCDDAWASRMLGMERDGLAWLIAAIRECYEECGLLLACDERGDLVAIEDSDTSAHYAALRGRLAGRTLTFAELCRARGLRPAVDRLAWFSHWITPPGAPRRFDTLFLVGIAPPRQIASHDGAEAIAHLWVRPADALERAGRDELRLVTATRTTLKALCGFSSVDEVMTYARTPREIPVHEPRVAMARDGKRVLIRGDAAYSEVYRLDPHGNGTASCEIVPGVVTALSPFVRRLTAPNPSVFTGSGTNTYLLGEGAELIVIDPGPAREEHVQALLKVTGGRIRRILVTHGHIDHAPAAAALKAASGAEVLGMPSPPDGFIPDRTLVHGECLRIAGRTLRVLHTPGHASSHLCYLLEDERLLFAGDHLMQGSTVVINPPDGNMSEYIASLRAMLREDIAWIAPGHGFLMDRPQEVIERLLRHRERREASVLAALMELGETSEEALLTIVYADVPPSRHALASRSLLAHLIKLEREERTVRQAGRWRALVTTGVC